MGLKSTYNSTYGATEGALRFESNSTQNASLLYSSQVVEVYNTGAVSCVPVIAAATSGYNPAFGHLTITGSSQTALTYYLAPPTSPYGQRITVKCLNTSTSSRQSVWASTDGSVTFDGTNQVAVFTSSGGNEFSNWFSAISVSSARWHLLGHSTTNLLLSTQSS
jgi:hypothetical protein